MVTPSVLARRHVGRGTAFARSTGRHMLALRPETESRVGLIFLDPASMRAASMPGRRLLVLALLLALPLAARAAEALLAAAGQTARAPAPRAEEDHALLNHLAEAQRALGDQLQQLREQVDALHDAIAAGNDA